MRDFELDHDVDPVEVLVKATINKRKQIIEPLVCAPPKLCIVPVLAVWTAAVVQNYAAVWVTVAYVAVAVVQYTYTYTVGGEG